MDLDDIFINLDWDPCYLESIFNQDFYEMAELWNEGYVEDSCLLEAIEKMKFINLLWKIFPLMITFFVEQLKR